MLTAFFVILMFTVFAKMIAWSFKAAWGLAKCMLCLVFLPVVILGIFAMGLVYLAIPILLIIGIIGVLH